MKHVSEKIGCLLLCLCLLFSSCVNGKLVNPAALEKRDPDASGAEDVQNEDLSESDARTYERENILTTTLVLPESFSPLTCSDAQTAQLLMLVFTPLVDVRSVGEPTDQGVVRRVELSEDGKTLKLHLRADLSFSNGEPVTVEDVLFTLQTFSAPGHWWSSNLRDLVRFTALEPETDAEEEALRPSDAVVELTFSAPVSEDRLGFLCLPVLPKNVYGYSDAPQWLAVGSGPYRVTDFQKMEYLLLEKNHARGQREPKISQIRIRIIRDPEAALTSFRHGLSQLLFEPIPTSLSIDNVSGNSVYFYENHRLRFLYLNQREGSPMASRYGRKGLMYALDPSKLLSQTAMRSGTVASSFVPAWISPNDPSRIYTASASRARTCFDKARVDSLTLVMEESDTLAELQAKILQRDLLAAGVTLQIETVTAAEWEKTLKEGRFDLAFGESDLCSTMDYADLFGSKGEKNLSGAPNEGMDYLLQMLEEAPDASERQAVWQRISSYLWDEVPICPLYYTCSSVIISRSLSGKLQGTTENALRGIENLMYP